MMSEPGYRSALPRTGARRASWIRRIAAWWRNVPERMRARRAKALQKKLHLDEITVWELEELLGLVGKSPAGGGYDPFLFFLHAEIKNKPGASQHLKALGRR